MDNFRLPQALKITAMKPENEQTKTFTLAGALAAEPGQFVMVWLPGLDEKPFSLAGAEPVSLTIAAVGPLSRALHRLEVGDDMWVRGPFGRGYHLPATTGAPKKLLLVGGGYGVAPLLFLARQAQARGYEVAMIIGAKSRSDLLLVETFTALGIPLWLTTEDGSQGQPGRVTGAIFPLLAEAQARPQAIYACGPTGMLQAVAALSRAAQIPVQLAWEAHMRCGIGLCGSCEVGQGWLTCLDGPVFPFNPLEVAPPAGEGGQQLLSLP
jgi:dihydroorotate dehydrogenase electron transfer subunit